MKKIICILLVFAMAGVLFTGCSSQEVTYDSAIRDLRAFKDSGVTGRVEEHHPDSTWVDNDDTIDELPPISKYPISVQGNGAIDIEIFSSTEKSSVKTPRWLDVLAKQFNSQNNTVGGKSASVTIRPIASGAALDYITTRKHLPAAYTPTNEYWAEMIGSSGVKLDLLDAKLTGNVAGILMSKTAAESFKSQYGETNMKSVTQAVLDGNLILGHTNPNISSTGLNIFLQELVAFDTSNPFSSEAITKFKDFQNKVPPVSNTTDDMATVAVSGIMDAIIMEAQEYSTRAQLSDWVFTPVGVRHDSPMYAVEGISADQQEVLEMFIDFCKTPAAQAEADKAGFNKHDEYTGIQNQFTGQQLLSALQIWKEHKDGGRPVVSVFIVDRSGSMAGEKLNRVKLALDNSLKYINEGNHVGLVSYSSANNITIDLPIDQFTPKQRSLFAGAVRDFEADGETATNNAIIVALNMLLDAKDSIPNAKFRILLLTDGQQNGGYGINRVTGLIKALEVPIYGVGFEANLTDLDTLAKINESYSINADSEDVVQKLRDLFIAEL